MITAYRLFGWVAAAAAGWWALEGAIRLGWGEGSRSLLAVGAAAVAAATMAACRWRLTGWKDADELDREKQAAQPQDTATRASSNR